MTSVWGVRQLSVGSGTFASLRNLDPYLIWTLKTRPNPFPVDGKSVFPGICVLVKFRKRDELGSEIGPNRDLTLFPTHFHSIRSPAQRTQWRSCVTNKKGLEVLMCSAANGGAGVERFELSEVRHGLANVELALKPEIGRAHV